MKFVKKPIAVEALRWTGDNLDQIRAFVGTRPGLGNPAYQIECFNPIGTYTTSDDPEITAEVWDHLHSTWVGVKTGQWIMHGTAGEFYPCAGDQHAPMNYVPATREQ